MTDNDKESDQTLKEVKLEEDQELRFEVASGSELLVELVSGTCELFGTELVQHRRIAFESGARGALYTWHGCQLELIGATESVYVAKQTPMIIYLNTHAALEQLRQHAESEALQKKESRGPRLMVAGPTDVGKSTYCRILLNYAVRQGRCPTFVDLDVGQGSVSIPGTIGALYIERPADIHDGFDKRNPVLYHFGSVTPSHNMQLFNQQVAQLANVVNDRCQASADANFAGVIVNTCGWVKGDGYACLVNAAESFEVDVVVVLDHERLYNDLQRDLPSFVRIVHQPKSGGVEERPSEMRIKSRNAKLRSYFYGVPKQPYYPHTFQVGFDEVNIVKVGADELPASCLPIGAKQQDHRTQIVRVSAGAHLEHHILAVSMADQQEQVLTANVAGFVCVTEVNATERTLTLLSPQPHPLPKNILVLSQVTFIDDK